MCSLGTTYISIYRKTSNRARGSYSFSDTENAGLTRNCVFDLLNLKIIAGLIRIRVLLEGEAC